MNISNNLTTKKPGKFVDPEQENIELMQDIIFTTISILGTFGNIFVLFIILKSTGRLRSTLSTIFIINQSLLDMTASLFLFADHWSSRLVDETKLSGTFLNWYCRGWYKGAWVWGILTGSSYNLVLLSLERYFSVTFAIAHKNLSKRKVIIAAVMVWLIFISYEFSHQTPTSTISETGHCAPFSMWPNDFIRRAVGVLIIVIQFIIPLIIIAFSYISLAITFSKKSKSVAPSQHAQDISQRVKKNSIKTFAIVAFAFVICWVFNQTYFLGFYFGLVNDLTGYYYHFSVFMVFVNCFINPFIYTFRYGEFKKELRKYRLFSLCFKARYGKDGANMSTDRTSTNY